MFDHYDWFKQRILELTHIDLNAYKERQMKRRIDALIVKNQLDSYEDYFKRIEGDIGKREEFVTYITINVSEFFRNPTQWEYLENTVYPELLRHFGNDLHIWSAACSTGDEPYSIVISLSRYLPLNQIHVYATDLDHEILAQAKHGVYHEKSLKNLKPEQLQRYFSPIDSRNYKISEEIKRCVTFEQHNLLLDDYPKGIHLILCRNVLIYFTEEAKEMVYERFADAQVKDGVLLIGSTEQIISAKQHGYETFSSFFYKKL